MLTFLASFILIIANVQKKTHSQLAFCGDLCKGTEGPIKNQKTNVTGLISILSPRLWTAIFWLSVLKIITTQNTNFWCVRRETNKKETRWHTSRDSSAKCGAKLLRMSINEKSITHKERIIVSTTEYTKFTSEPYF
jgi:hypothetical protein